MCTIWAYEDIKHKHDVYRDNDCMKKFCESLKERAVKMFSFIPSKYLIRMPLGNEHQEL